MRRLFVLPLLAALLAYALLPLPGSGAPLNKRIDRQRGKVEQKRRQEGVLTTTISRYNNHLNALGGRINGLAGRERRVQSTLDTKRAVLLGARDRREKARDRLVTLRSRLTRSQRVLAVRLVAIYKSNQPDVLSVVLSADGFPDLLDRADFLKRVGNQDQRVIAQVRTLKAQATHQENALAAIEKRAADAAQVILSRRNDLAAARTRIAQARDDIAGVRANKARTLAAVRTSRRRAQEDLGSLQRQQAKITAKLQQSQGGGGNVPDTPIKKGNGQFIWPVNGPITSPFCERRSYEACHPGMDIGVGMGTPIHAAAAGKVALAGPNGGYGNYTCINHSSSLSTCYAHQSSIGVSVGQSVKQGQVIGAVGNTGHSFGPHLHFEVRVNGAITNPLNYL